MTTTFDLRLRRHDAAGEPREIIQHQTLDFTGPLGAVATMTATVSEKIVGVLPDVTELAVEIWNGSTWAEAPNGRFIVNARAGDELDVAGIRTLTGVNVVSWVLSKNTLASVNGEPRTWNDTAGLVLNSVLTEARARGWGHSINWSFTPLADSAGQRWNDDARIELDFEAGQTAQGILQLMADQGFLEWSTTGRTLHVHNTGTGENRSNGAGLQRIGGTSQTLPVETTIADLSTHTMVIGESNWTFPVEGAGTSPYGRLETAVQAGGVNTLNAAQILAGVSTKTGRGPRHQYTVTEDAAVAQARPFVDYQLGDTLSVRRANGFEPMRVVEIQLRADGATTAIDVTLEDRLTTEAAAAAKNAARIGRLGGNGKMKGGIGGGGSVRYAFISPGFQGVGGQAYTTPDRGSDVVKDGPYPFLDNYSPAEGDRVALVGDLILGRAIGSKITERGTGEVLELSGEWGSVRPDRYGDPFATLTSSNWVVLRGVVRNLGNSSTSVLQLPGTMRPVTTVRVPVGIVDPATGAVTGHVMLTIHPDGWMVADVETAEGENVRGDALSLAGIAWNVQTSGLTVIEGPSSIGYAVDPLGMTYLFGTHTGSTPQRFVFAPVAAPRRFAHTQSGVYRPGDTEHVIAGVLNTDVPLDGSRFQSEGLEWKRLELINGFTHGEFGAATSLAGPVEFAKREDGLVLLRGRAENGVHREGGTVLGTLPADYRPSYDTPFASAENSDYGFTVTSGGTVMLPERYMAMSAQFNHSMFLASH